MAAEDSNRAIGSATGGTSGTGQPDTNPEMSGGDLAERERDAAGLAGGDDTAGEAIGEGGGARVSGTGGAPARSGRLSSEGSGATLPNPPDPGDPGGMGGVGASRNAPSGRPPGGVSPIEDEEV